tara:strand:- start:2783 stop:3457 length:675 start_codon:yes stop_codon:yes gene_type:complete
MTSASVLYMSPSQQGYYTVLTVDQYTDDYEGGKNIMVNIGHENFDIDLPVDQQWYGVGQRLYRATGASYTFTVNPDEGIIIALNRESPKWAAKDRRPEVPDNLLPQLNQFSDVAWVSWKSMVVPPWSNGVPVNSLKYFMAVRITNTETRQILKRALDANHWELSEWPGHTFERVWPETKAILGESAFDVGILEKCVLVICKYDLANIGYRFPKYPGLRILPHPA